MDSVINFLTATMDVVWYVTWRSFLVYMCYRLKGEVGIIKAISWGLFWVTLFGAAGMIDGFKGDKLVQLESYINGIVLVSVCVVGSSGSLMNILYFAAGFSTSHEGGVINRVLKGDKDK